MGLLRSARRRSGHDHLGLAWLRRQIPRQGATRRPALAPCPIRSPLRFNITGTAGCRRPRRSTGRSWRRSPITWPPALISGTCCWRPGGSADSHDGLLEAGAEPRVPEARVLVALCDPRDVCLSCFMQRFRLDDSMINFCSLEQTAETYAAVMDLCPAYRDRLTLAWREFRYEDLVEDFEAVRARPSRLRRPGLARGGRRLPVTSGATQRGNAQLSPGPARSTGSRWADGRPIARRSPPCSRCWRPSSRLSVTRRTSRPPT